MNDSSRPSIAERLARVNDRPSGFDYLRLLLAAGVIAQHSVNVTLGQRAANDLFFTEMRPIYSSIIPAFFVLSGFLVAGSLDRCRTLIYFVGLRCIRILPALFVETVLSALLIGPLASALSPSQYFGSPEFYAYFLNIIGDVHTTLPQVFTQNPLPLVVNAQLWTIPFELECYAALSCLALISIARKPKVFSVVVALIQIAVGIYALSTSQETEIIVRGRLLILCFLCGVVGYQLRDSIPHRLSLFCLSLLCLITAYRSPVGQFFIAIPTAYATLYLGVLNPPRLRFLFSGDYSYGMYLYGFPIQQVLVAISPWPMNCHANAVASIATAFALAHLSWRFVEKPASWFRKPLRALEDYTIQKMRRLRLALANGQRFARS